MALQIIRSNIINVEADAIVNTAAPGVTVGRGVDYAVYSAAGWDRLFADRMAIGEIMPGDARCTPAYDLKADYIIHTVGPAWHGGNVGEQETVASCYRNSLALAEELGCESIAFPLIATGTYGFPKDEALRIAIREISSFLLNHEMEVLLVVYDKESFEVSGKLFSDIRSFIEDIEEIEDSEDLEDTEDENTEDIGEGGSSAPEAALAEESSDLLYTVGSPLLENKPECFSDVQEIAVPLLARNEGPTEENLAWKEGSLEERLEHLDKTFQEYLFMLIDRRGLTDPEVYKKANIDRKHFSKIRSNTDYKPSKRTALALAIALELSLDETQDLLLRAGLALSPSSIFDRIIEYCLEHRVYDIYEINCTLFKYDQPTLGA